MKASELRRFFLQDCCESFDVIRCRECIYNPTCNTKEYRNDMLALLDKAKKYCWHNLKEDPKDLPSTDNLTTCEVVLENIYEGIESYGHGRYVELSDGNYWLVEGYYLRHPKYDNHNGGDSYHKVIAWRYVEPLR